MPAWYPLVRHMPARIVEYATTRPSSSDTPPSIDLKIPEKKKAAPNPQNPSFTDLATLGRELLSSRSHIKNLPILVKHTSVSSPPRHALKSLFSLQSFFTPLLVELRIGINGNEEDED
ncbi:hypothetical protein Droror1_Dr00025635 [Drosera rotundifolia]